MGSGNQTKFIISISFLVTICLIVFIALNANRFMQSMSENNSRLYDAYRISELMKSFRSNVTAMESKERSYIVTGDPKFREEYKLRETETKTYLQLMEKYFIQKPEEALFVRLKELTYQKIMQAKNLSHTMPGIPLMPEELEQGQNLGIQTMDEINSTIDLINQSLGTTTRNLINNSVSYVHSSRNWGLMEVGAGVLATLIAVVILFRDINVRNRLEVELRVAKKQADDNAMMKEQFMANMSHEIRTPMNAILGFADLLHKTPLDTTQAEYLSAIRYSSTNLLSIINDILDFSKIEAGMLSVERIPFSIQEVIASLRVIFEEKTREKGLEFRITADTGVPAMVCGDPTRLTQILVNLLNNAVKFTHQGTVDLSVCVQALSKEEVKLLFIVKDTGVGIPADKQDGVFERFNQGNAETTRKYGGTGLGLSIVKSLLEMQNGSIHFTSKEGEGSEFSAEISYSLPGTEKQDYVRTIVPLPALFEKTCRILVVEDNPLNQKLTGTLLESFGLQADVVGDGAVALEKLSAVSYDMVLMDIQMPVLDGYQTTLKIREELKLNLPVIAMTANSMEGEMQKCLSYGMNGYISKPFREEELYHIMCRFLNKEQITETEQPRVETPDLSSLYGMAKGNRQFIHDMATLFVAQNPTDISALGYAINRGDYDRIAAVAHRMKTSVGFMGMRSLMQPLNEMEQLAKQKENIEMIQERFVVVRAVCGHTVSELHNMLENDRYQNNTNT